MTRGHDRLLIRLYPLLDWLVMECSFMAAWWLKFKSGLIPSYNTLSVQTYMYWGVVYGFIALAVGAASTMYHPVKSNASRLAELWGLARAHVISLSILISLLFAFREIHLSRTFLILFFVLNIMLLSAGRSCMRAITRRRRKRNRPTVLIAGAGAVGREVHSSMMLKADSDCQVAGYLDCSDFLETMAAGKGIEGAAESPLTNTLKELLLARHIDEVMIALPAYAEGMTGEFIHICEQHGVKTSLVPDYSRFLPARPYLTEYSGIPVIQVRDIPLEEASNRLLKRCFDICFSLLVIILALPVMLLIAIAIKLTSRGPVLFRQERMGMDRKGFWMYKFRTMKQAASEETDTVWTVRDDLRRTPVGAFLRRTSLDELPQFFNVLTGDMSVVGPRPERPYFVKQFRETVPRYMVKHHIRPGITGWAQVSGWRGDTSIEERIKCDLYYMENWTFSMDLKIIAKTVLVGFSDNNAY